MLTLSKYLAIKVNDSTRQKQVEALVISVVKRPI